MRKYLIALIGIVILILIFCYTQKKWFDISVSKKDTITFSLNGNFNIERLQKYIEDVGNKKKDKINIIQYTTEGDPITTQLDFNGKNIKVGIDNSKDKFGGQDKNKIIYNIIYGDNQLKDNLIKYLTDNHIYNP
jgi:hypothetical protein